MTQLDLHWNFRTPEEDKHFFKNSVKCLGMTTDLATDHCHVPYPPNNNVIIFGNNLGDISTFCSSKYFILNDQAHPNSAINCIKVTNCLSLDMKTVTVITGGEDGYVRIWDASIQLK